MRKKITHEDAQGTRSPDQDWLDLENLVQVELTSEDAQHPIESALSMNTGSGWRAQQPGKQTIRLLFDKPHRISRIRLMYQEDERVRYPGILAALVAGRWSILPGDSTPAV